MKKRTHTGKKGLSFRLSLAGSAAMPRVRSQPKPEEMDRLGDDAGLTIVPGPQFQALLDLIENPPGISDELRREVAAARLWK